ncbi:MAG: DUF4203 domain-containing protein [Archaeoglobaceae archaeon]
MYESLVSMISPPVAVALMIVVGLLLCLAGYRFFKLYTAAIGFIIGFIIGSYFWHFSLFPIASGVVSAIFFWLIYRLGLFVTGAVVGYMFADMILPDKLIYSYPTAILFGLLTLFLEKAMLILITAFLGSTAVTFAVYTITSGELFTTFVADPRHLVLVVFASPLYFLLWLVLGVIGVVSQLVIAKEEKKSED